MGVDWYTCENEDCRENFPDCGNYVSCEGCGSHFCSDDCGLVKYRDDNEDETDCILCRMEKVGHGDLLFFLINKMGINYDQAVDMYRKEHNAKKES